MKFKFRYSLRILLFAVLGLSLVTAMFTWRLNRARDQRQVIDELKVLLRRTEGEVHYDYQYTPAQEKDGKYVWPAWITMPAPQRPNDWGLGIDFWQQPYWVELYNYQGSVAETDRLFDLISKLPTLTGIVLRNSENSVRGQHLLQLQQSVNLQIIYWQGPLHDDTFAALGEHSQLRYLGFEHSEHGYLADVKSWSVLAKLSHLREFVAPYGPAPDAAATALTNCRGLWSLNLSDGQITDVGAQAISQLQELRGLMLSGNQITSAGTRDWGALTKLQRLWLDHSLVDDSTLEVLAKLPKIRELRLNNVHFTGSAFTKPNAFPTLTELWIGSNQLSQETWKALARHPQLELLSIDGTGMFAPDVVNIVSFNKLAALYLDGAELSPQRWQAIGRLPVLKEIRVSRAGNLDAAFLSQQQSVGITSLMLQECELSRASLLHLLQHLPALRSLSLYGTNLTQADVNAARQATSARIEGFSKELGRGWY